jgi:hypothetical protein
MRRENAINGNKHTEHEDGIAIAYLRICTN